MEESTSYAIATQQGHATGNVPKGYGTEKGKRKALRKYDEGESQYKQIADPKTKTKESGISLASILGFSNELEKISNKSMFSPPGLAEMKKSIQISPKKQSYSKVNTAPPPPPSGDPLVGSKSAPPPPVTAS